MKKRTQGTAAKTSRSSGSTQREARARATDPTRESDSGKAGGKTLMLAADCSVLASASLRSALLDLQQTTAPVTIDMARVQCIDTAGMQLLAAFVRDRDLLGHQVEWRGSAPAISSAARLLGLIPLLRLPERAS